MLGSNVLFEQALAAAQYLEKGGLLCIPEGNLLGEHEQRIVQALSQPIFPPIKQTGEGCKYRYPKMRASHICQSAAMIYSRDRTLRGLLMDGSNTRETRNSIIASAKGIGPKQASLFLRNIGYANDVAILDVHILRYMSAIGLYMGGNSNVCTVRGYDKVEANLRGYADGLCLELSYLDIAIWVVMRVYQREFAT
ncbi:MAG TPA: hypothetical protein VF914_01595 [Chloroflexia bacterium]|jgi:N-glycosylase/DNA lyase